MDDPRQKHGNHTWDMPLHYYQCPQCGYIIEDQTKYEIRFKHLIKNLVCSRCKKPFIVQKNIHQTFGPLLGHNPEIDD